MIILYSFNPRPASRGAFLSSDTDFECRRRGIRIRHHRSAHTAPGTSLIKKGAYRSEKSHHKNVMANLVFTANFARLRLNFFFYKLFTNNARIALSTAIIITPTSANMATHILATPSAPRTRHSSFMPMANTVFS